MCRFGLDGHPVVVALRVFLLLVHHLTVVVVVVAFASCCPFVLSLVRKHFL
jgi:hypothetical protein